MAKTPKAIGPLRPLHTATRPLGHSPGQMKFCYGCQSWSNVYDDQSICPKCGKEGLRER